MKHKRLIEKVSEILDKHDELSIKQIQTELIDSGLKYYLPSATRLSQILRGRFDKREVSRKNYMWRKKDVMD